MDLSLNAVREMLEFHYDRRDRLFDYSAALPPDELVRPVRCTWSSALGILLHEVACEEFWFHHVIREDTPRPHDLATYPDLASVRRLADEVRAKTMEWAGSLNLTDLAGEVVYRWSSDGMARFTVGGIIRHVVTHGAYHRGQVLLLASQYGHDIPELD
jgi:uncharacterized damage-inducible protein DinB